MIIRTRRIDETTIIIVVVFVSSDSPLSISDWLFDVEDVCDEYEVVERVGNGLVIDESEEDVEYSDEEVVEVNCEVEEGSDPDERSRIIGSPRKVSFEKISETIISGEYTDS